VVLVRAADDNGWLIPSYPAYYANLIAVAATDHNAAKASFSEYGTRVEVAALNVVPGRDHVEGISEAEHGEHAPQLVAVKHRCQRRRAQF
jgi:Subtilase family